MRGDRRRLSGRIRVGLAAALAASAGVSLLWAASRGAQDVPRIYAASPNEVRFASRPAKHVRFVIERSVGGQPCIDELEVYGAGSDRNLALASAGAQASASSCLSGYTAHRVAHLNDGRYGNSNSWIAASDTGGEWAQITLAEPAEIDRIVFSRDRKAQFADRIPVWFAVQTSADGARWETVTEVHGDAAPAGAAGQGSVPFRQEHAKYVRLWVLGTRDGAAPALDEVEVYGKEPDVNVAATDEGASVSASSTAAGDEAALNDGKYGVGSAWQASSPSREWIQVALRDRMEVNRLVFTRDRVTRRMDGTPTVYEVRISLDGRRWKTVAREGWPAMAPPPPTVAIAADVIASEAKQSPPKTDSLGLANLALAPGARAGASSVIPGLPNVHAVSHLNDGRYGNDASWVSSSDPSWAEVDLGAPRWVARVAFGSDCKGQFGDRAATSFRVLAASAYARSSASPTWTTVARRHDHAGVSAREEFAFKPIRARWVRVAVDAARDSSCRIDELEVFGSPDPMPAARVAGLPDWPRAGVSGPVQSLGLAFLGEEMAWLKAFGRADMDAGLTEYVRVWEYPDHKPEDFLPLPKLPSGPALDADLGDACWKFASRGVARVARMETFPQGPLVEQAVWAGRQGDDLCLAIRADRLLSAHAAVISGGDWAGCGALTFRGKSLTFDTFDGSGKPAKSLPVTGTVDAAMRTIEVRLPLGLFPRCSTTGIRVGLGLGGKHTSHLGSGVLFSFADLSIAQEPAGGDFRVRVTASSPVTVDGHRLHAGETRVIDAPARKGPIGPERDFAVNSGGREPWTLHLFRYDPAERALTLAEEMADRFARDGVDVSAERRELAALRARQKRASASAADSRADRDLFLNARMAKRRLFLRAPQLAAAARVLCVKRHPFAPSHNYSDLLDAGGAMGGSVGIISMPWANGRLDTDRASYRKLFNSGAGIARDPAAARDLGKVWFSWKDPKDGYFHLMTVRPDGLGLKRVTNEPFHDLYPTPLPDGGMAFISTRCRQRFLCWRPQAYVLFRMTQDGKDVRPLSHANLSEWAPSVTGDGRILWTRSEYQDKGADFSHTLWTVRPDGTHADLLFGNTIIQPNGYANGREMPGARDVACTLISHFGDLNGPITLIDRTQGPFDHRAIRSLTPEVPWPGAPPGEECFRDPQPIGRDYLLVSHAPQSRFGVYLLDRWGNRELLYSDPAISVMCPTPFRRAPRLPTPAEVARDESAEGELVVANVYEGLGADVKPGSVRWIRVSQEVRANLERLPDGRLRADHEDFTDWYATPVHLVSGPYGWPSYVAKASWGLVPVAPDGSARFKVPAGKVLYFSLLDARYREIQRMRSLVQLAPGETRGCIGCHESRGKAPTRGFRPTTRLASTWKRAPWEGAAFSYEHVVQPVLNRNCTGCHDGSKGIPDLRGTAGEDKVPTSYRTLISEGWVHYLDWSYNPGGNEKADPLTFGTVRSKLVKLLEAGHHGVNLTQDDDLRLKTWIDLNCPLWPDYKHRPERVAGGG